MSEENENVKDCFEKVNRVTFAFNQGLDKAIFEPIAKGYRHLPSPIRFGTSNVLNNLSNLVTIPNNILQGNMKDAGINTIRLVVNSTFGLLGVFDAAQFIGFEQLEKEEYIKNNPYYWLVETKQWEDWSDSLEALIRDVEEAHRHQLKVKIKIIASSIVISFGSFSSGIVAFKDLYLM